MWATCVSMVRAGQSELLIGDFTFTFWAASGCSALTTLAGRGTMPAPSRGLAQTNDIVASTTMGDF